MDNATTRAEKIKIRERSPLYWAFSDTWVLIKRSLEHIFRNTDQLLGLTIEPIMFLLLFRYVFGGAIETGGVDYVNFLVAGILVQMAAFGANTTAISVATDMKRGIIDRFKSLPMVSSAVMTGHVVADLVRNILSSIIMIIAAFFVGFHPQATVQTGLLFWESYFCLRLRSHGFRPSWDFLPKVSRPFSGWAFSLSFH
jgi:ABC-2 type transport system permease protein